MSRDLLTSVGDFGDDDIFAVLADLFDGGLGAHQRSCRGPVL